MPGLKRPAAAGTRSRKKSRNSDETVPTVMEVMKPREVVNGFLTRGGFCHVGENQSLFRWGSAFDGTNMPAYCLKQLEVKAEHVFGAEKALAPCYFSLCNFKQMHGHLFEDRFSFLVRVVGCCWLNSRARCQAIHFLCFMLFFGP